MSVYGQEKQRELHEHLSAYIHGGADCDNAGDIETTTPGSPDSLFDSPSSPGPSNIASAFATAASGPALSHSLSTRRSQAVPEIEAQVEADADSGGWTSTESNASRASSVGPDASFAAGTGGHGGARGVGCWSCNAMVSIRRKEMIIMCAGCGGRIMMKLRPERWDMGEEKLDTRSWDWDAVVFKLQFEFFDFETLLFADFAALSVLSPGPEKGLLAGSQSEDLNHTLSSRVFL
ncbi:hypothetical protein HOY82DRAFT_639817 [Tuber indicum]|nr:hypothetical protein HOY82DRAFT_639817 [Tuber indicum]